jgi:hypothetical protein
VADSFCSATAKPASSQSCTMPSSCYEWSVGTWSTCSNDCGGGISSASISCVQSSAAPQPGTAVASSFCTTTQPASTKTCNTGACPVTWQASGFGLCTVSCGGGTMSQQVVCVQTQNGLASSVGDQYCVTSQGSKPATSQPCNTQTCTDGQYSYSSWSTCSASCGGGIQTRAQQCLSPTGTVYPDNSRCATQTAQPTQQACNTQSQAITLAHICSQQCQRGTFARMLSSTPLPTSASHTLIFSLSFLLFAPSASLPELQLAVRQLGRLQCQLWQRKSYPRHRLSRYE